MKQLRPVKKTYTPGYPKKLNDEEIQEALRPALYKRFSRKALLTGAIVAGSTLSFEGDVAAAENDTTAELDKQAHQLAENALGSFQRANWYQSTTIVTHKLLSSNPPIKIPRIPISFGNSYSGIFDVVKARKVTEQLFELYGIDLKPNVRLEGEQWSFKADGFNNELGIGFKLMTGRGKSRANRLDENELPMLDDDIKSGAIKMFVANAQAYPNMDGDLYTPMRYYLASVVDYLNWIHGGREIDPESVLGDVPRDIKMDSTPRQ